LLGYFNNLYVNYLKLQGLLYTSGRFKYRQNKT